MRRLFLTILTSFHVYAISAQDPIASQYAEMISVSSLRENLSIIASDALEGRETGKRGQKMAAAFISSHFQEIGLQAPVNGGYYQALELYSPMAGETYIKAGGFLFPNFDQIVYAGTDESAGEMTLPAVFAGLGRPKDFENLPVKDKAVFIINGENEPNSIRDFVHQNDGKMVFVISPDPKFLKEATQKLQSHYRRQPMHLDKIVFSIGNDGLFYVSTEVAEKTFNVPFEKLKAAAEAKTKRSGIRKIKPGQVAYKTSMTLRTLKTENVLGYLEGAEKKDEVVIVTAHYDHLGKMRSGEGDVIRNGADDDGSGTVAVMELAKVFMKAAAEGHAPKRSILFMTVSAEEIGLLGSDYYTRYPVFPLQNTVVDLNIDMIGRRDAQHKQSSPYIYVIGADKISKELNQLSETVNNMYTKLTFDYTYNDENHPDRLYYRSDHWNFAKNNVPIIFYFDGIHEDYHRVTDEVGKIEFDLLRTRAQCIFLTAWEIANREKRIALDLPQN
jgi:hypothetical protein